jgi:hypothetical protein
MTDRREDVIADYWAKHYATEHCTLCGNHGVIDTRATAVTPAGVWVGRVNFCICPNGMVLRERGDDAEATLRLSQRREI